MVNDSDAVNDVHVDETATVVDSEMKGGAGVWKHAFVKNCFLEKFSSIGDFTRTEDSAFGEHVQIQRNGLIYSSSFGRRTYTGKNFTCWHASIGAFCSISWNVSLGGADHDYRKLTTHSFLYLPNMGLSDVVGYDRFSEPCDIGNDVWIGCHAVVCRGVTIGDGAVIGAGAVVTHDVPPYTIAAGCPARVLKPRFDGNLAERLLRLRWWEFSDDVIKDNIALFNHNADEKTISRLEDLRTRTDGLRV